MVRIFSFDTNIEIFEELSDKRILNEMKYIYKHFVVWRYSPEEVYVIKRYPNQ